MKHLHKLLADNRGRGFVRAEKSEDEATLYIYDAIVSDDSWGGVGAAQLVKEIVALDAPVIHLRINSPGGDVFAARAIEQAIREHNSHVIAHIDGYAASAASYLALAADEVHIAQGGFFMIHKAWTVAWGNSDDLLSTAALLEKVDESLVATYASETGQDAAAIREWMRAETWFSADEAVEYGFADKIADGASAKAMSKWDLAAYANAPAAKQEPTPDPDPAPAADWDTDHLKRQLALAAASA